MRKRTASKVVLLKQKQEIKELRAEIARLKLKLAKISGEQQRERAPRMPRRSRAVHEILQGLGP